MNDDEIDKFEKKFTLDDYSKENSNIFNKNNYIKICSDFPINPACNNAELYLTTVIKTDYDIKYL